VQISRSDALKGEIRQVLSNLVGNAIDAMEPLGGGRLLLPSRVGRDWTTGRTGLVITVADTGSGMSGSVTSRTFEPFYTTKGIGGTGLGLWVSSGDCSTTQWHFTFPKQ
jgi:signal transduction histidine kinase